MSIMIGGIPKKEQPKGKTQKEVPSEEKPKKKK